MKPEFIYLLRDPRSGDVRYVGKTNDIRSRVIGHCTDARRGARDHKAAWIRALLAIGMRPVIASLYRIPQDSAWQHCERFFIAAAKSFGLPVTNITRGGDVVHHSPEQERRRRAGLTAWYSKPENLQRRAKEMRETMRRPDVRAKFVALMASPVMREKHRQTALSPEVRAKKSAAMRAYFDDPIWKATWRKARYGILIAA